MVKIPLTTFLDFTTASGTARLTQVRKAHRQEGVAYQPATDYWRPLRNGIRDAFEADWSAVDAIDHLKQVSSDPRKQDRYQQCLSGLERWTRNTTFGRSIRRSGVWESGGLLVTVNPELLLEIDGVPTAVKLYFRGQILAKPSVNTLLYLIGEAVPGNPRPAILDVPRGRLIVETVAVADLDIVLEGDAAQFMTMWRRLNEVVPQQQAA
jgi:hypothetical protein